MEDDLAGKVAIVTGGASGIVRATVEKLHEQGAAVVVSRPQSQ
jgi:NAD(P)-dependent dehydrogenase (short-subunit alcohol dehydrogenase family)